MTSNEEAPGWSDPCLATMSLGPLCWKCGGDGKKPAKKSLPAAMSEAPALHVARATVHREALPIIM